MVPTLIVNHVATDAVLILDVFSKKSAATPDEVLTNCKDALRLTSA